MSRKKLSKVRRADPFFERESARYDFPLPSREYVSQVLADEGRPLEFTELTGLLDIADSEREMFQRRLGAMEREGQLMRNRKGAYILPERASLTPGRVQGHPDGYGFLIPDDGSADIFLDQHQMGKVLHGDRALVRVVGVDRKGRPEGSIVEVTERVNTRLVGRVLVENGVTLVVPENRRISQEILLAPGKAKFKPVAGQVVVVELTEPPALYGQPVGRVAEVLGEVDDPGMEIEIAVRKYGVPHEFSEECLAQAKALPDKVRAQDKKRRVDLTDVPLVTIDGEDARDFDDAVYCEPAKVGRSKGWRLLVAIADVSHYVHTGNAIDIDAYERATSVYFPRRVIPMLPEKLSNGLCSLNPEVDRLCMVCDMLITSEGELHAYQFYPAVMHSHARFTYTQVAAILSNTRGIEARRFAERVDDLLNLHAVTDRSSWPRSPKGLADQLRRIAPAYRSKGIDITPMGHGREGALWRISTHRSTDATPPSVTHTSVGGIRYGAHRE